MSIKEGVSKFLFPNDDDQVIISWNYNNSLWALVVK